MGENAFTNFKDRYSGNKTVADNLTDDTEKKLIAAYTNLWSKLYSSMDEARRSPSYTSASKQTALLKQTAEMLVDFKAASGTILDKSMGLIAEYSTKIALKDTSYVSEGGFIKPEEWHYAYNKKYAEQTFKDAYTHIAAQTDRMEADVKQTLRKEAAQIFQKAAVEGISRKEATRLLAREMGKAVPDFKFVDKAGKQWSNATYFSMLARTVMSNTLRETYINTLANEGHDLVKVSSHSSICALCRKWEGQILSITGKTKEYGTLADAIAQGLFHPNCKHRLLAYHKDIENVFEKIDSMGDAESKGFLKAASADLSKKIAKAEAKQAEEEEAANDPYKQENFKQIGAQQGSNEGGLYVNTVTGEKFYIKVPKTELHARNEALAAELYRAAGIDAPNIRLVDWGKKLAVASQWEEGLKKPNISSKTEMRLFHKGFAVDAWLANWDVVGLSYDNIAITKNGNPFRLDTGGAMLYRAQGSPKGSAFGDKVTELDSLRNAGINPQAARVFGGISQTALINSMKLVEKISDDQIFQAINKVGFYGGDAAALHGQLIQRRLDITEQRLVMQRVAKVAKSGGLELSPEDKNWWGFQKPTTEDRKLVTEHWYYKTYEGYQAVKDLMAKGIAKEDAVSLLLYTNGSYGALNKALRLRGEQASGKDWVVAHVRCANNAIMQLKNIELAEGKKPVRETYRKIDLGNNDLKQFEEVWKVGTVNKAYDFWSTSTSKSIWNGNVLINITTKTGAYIDDYSTHPGEKEVLLRAGAKYKVTKVDASYKYKRIFWMEEV